MFNRDHIKLSIAALNSALDNDKKINLRRRVSDLESELANIMKEAKSREETLQHLLKEKERTYMKLNNDLEIAKRKRTAVESQLKCVRHNQQINNCSIRLARASENDMSQIAAIDREWITTTKATRHKSESEFTRIKQSITVGW